MAKKMERKEVVETGLTVLCRLSETERVAVALFMYDLIRQQFSEHFSPRYVEHRARSRRAKARS